MEDSLLPKRPCCSGEPSPSIRKIAVGQAIVGLVGLDDILAQLRRMGHEPSPDLADELLDMVKTRNYVPPAAADLYKEALLREYSAYCAELEEG